MEEDRQTPTIDSETEGWLTDDIHYWDQVRVTRHLQSVSGGDPQPAQDAICYITEHRGNFVLGQLYCRHMIYLSVPVGSETTVTRIGRTFNDIGSVTESP